MNCLFQIGPEAQVAEMTDTDEIKGLTQVLEDVARRLGWLPGCQLRVCQPVTRHFAVLVRGEAIGGLQLVTPLDSGRFAFRSVWPDAVINDARAAHVPILALREEYRGRFGLFWPLCVELWRCCCAQGIQTIVLEATPATLKLYQRLGWPLEVVGELRPHWGEDCCLCRMDVQDVAADLAVKAQKSQTYRLLTEQAYRPGLISDQFDLPGREVSHLSEILLPAEVLPLADVLLPAEEGVRGKRNREGEKN